MKDEIFMLEEAGRSGPHGTAAQTEGLCDETPESYRYISIR